MWTVRKTVVYEIFDDNTKTVIASGLNEEQAQAVCSRHNEENSLLKWGSENKKGERI